MSSTILLVLTPLRQALERIDRQHPQSFHGDPADRLGRVPWSGVNPEVCDLIGDQ